MPAPSISDLKSAFAVSDIGDPRLTFCLDTASQYVKNKIGYDIWAEVFLGGSSTIEDSDEDEDATTVNETAARLAGIKTAVLYHAMANVLINANLRIRRAGQVKKEQDAGSPAMGSTTIINEYLTPSEVSEWRSALLSDAEMMLTPYVTTTSLAYLEMQRG